MADFTVLRRGSPLEHWFNHQTHHRGQAHALSTGLVGEARNSISCFSSGCRQGRQREKTTTLQGLRLGIWALPERIQQNAGSSGADPP